MVIVPWFTGFSPRPSPRTKSGSKWIGFGSAMRTLNTFMAAPSTTNRRSGSRSPTPASDRTGGLSAREDEGLAVHGHGARPVLQVELEGHQVEGAAAALLALDVDDLAADGVVDVALERPPLVEGGLAEDHAVLRRGVGELDQLLDRDPHPAQGAEQDPDGMQHRRLDVA